MTEHQGDREALAVAEGLTGALRGVRDQLEAINARVDGQEEMQRLLVSYGRRNRHLIRMVFTSIVVDVILTVFLVFVYGTAHSAHAIATAQHQSIVAGCQLNNTAKAEQVTLWTHLVAISHPKPGESKAQVAAGKRQAAAFLGYVRHVFAKRNCAKAYKIP